MKISIIIATLNSEATLQRAINSIMCQTNQNVEILIADGGSLDSTVDIIKACDPKLLTWWTSSPDKSLYEAWNRAIEHITGDWVLFLGSDDELWDSEVINSFVSKGSELEGYNIVYAKVAHVLRDGRTWSMGGEPWLTTKKRLKNKGSMMAHQGVFHNRSLFERGERFDSAFKISGDYDFLLRVLKKEDALFLDGLVAAKMYYGGLSSGYNNLNFHREFLQARKNNGYRINVWILLLRLRYFFRTYLINFFGLKRTIAINNFFRKALKKEVLPTDY